MNKISEMINLAIMKMMLMIESFNEEERGDTNFISIAIILVVVLGLAVIFIGFGDSLTTGLTEAINELKGALGIG